MSSQLVDLHCHILPGIDDGAKNLDVSMSLIQKEMEDGVVGIVFTPHFHYERITLDAFVQHRARRRCDDLRRRRYKRLLIVGVIQY